MEEAFLFRHERPQSIPQRDLTGDKIYQFTFLTKVRVNSRGGSLTPITPFKTEGEVNSQNVLEYLWPLCLSKVHLTTIFLGQICQVSENGEDRSREMAL